MNSKKLFLLLVNVAFLQISQVQTSLTPGQFPSAACCLASSVAPKMQNPFSCQSFAQQGIQLPPCEARQAQLWQNVLRDPELMGQQPGYNWGQWTLPAIGVAVPTTMIAYNLWKKRQLQQQRNTAEEQAMEFRRPNLDIAPEPQAPTLIPAIIAPAVAASTQTIPQSVETKIPFWKRRYFMPTAGTGAVVGGAGLGYLWNQQRYTPTTIATSSIQPQQTVAPIISPGELLDLESKANAICHQLNEQAEHRKNIAEAQRLTTDVKQYSAKLARQEEEQKNAQMAADFNRDIALLTQELKLRQQHAAQLHAAQQGAAQKEQTLLLEKLNSDIDNEQRILDLQTQIGLLQQKKPTTSHLVQTDTHSLVPQLQLRRQPMFRDNDSEVFTTARSDRDTGCRTPTPSYPSSSAPTSSRFTWTEEYVEALRAQGINVTFDLQNNRPIFATPADSAKYIESLRIKDTPRTPHARHVATTMSPRTVDSDDDTPMPCLIIPQPLPNVTHQNTQWSPRPADRVVSLPAQAASPDPKTPPTDKRKPESSPAQSASLIKAQLDRALQQRIAEIRATTTSDALRLLHGTIQRLERQLPTSRQDSFKFRLYDTTDGEFFANQKQLEKFIADLKVAYDAKSATFTRSQTAPTITNAQLPPAAITGSL